MQRHILCIGFDYFDHHSPFAKVCKARRAEILKTAPPGQDVTVEVFDFAAGSRTTTLLKWANGKATILPQNCELLYDPVTFRSYENVALPGQPKEIRLKPLAKAMSITDVYATIEHVGKTDPGSLLEVGIYSHGWVPGPVLLNSNDRVTTNALDLLNDDLRDPYDKDGRLKDFNDANLPEEKRKQFTDAFQKDGYVWCWGCAQAVGVHQILLKVQREIRPTSQEQVLQFRRLTRQQIDMFSFLMSTREFDRELTLKSLKFDVKFEVFRTALWRLVETSFALRLARRTKVIGIGALPGTDAVFVDGDRKMRINPLLERHADFYHRWFGVPLAPGTHYGLFRHDLKMT